MALPEDDTVLIEEVKTKLHEPPRCAVVLHNDDYTTMEFVIEVLQKFFQKSEEEAMKIMLKIHHEGQGVAGIYSPEIAETKAVQVNDYAKERSFPLKATCEEV